MLPPWETCHRRSQAPIMAALRGGGSWEKEGPLTTRNRVLRATVGPLLLLLLLAS